MKKDIKELSISSGCPNWEELITLQCEQDYNAEQERIKFQQEQEFKKQQLILRKTQEQEQRRQNLQILKEKRAEVLKKIEDLWLQEQELNHSILKLEGKTKPEKTVTFSDQNLLNNFEEEKEIISDGEFKGNQSQADGDSITQSTWFYGFDISYFS